MNRLSGKRAVVTGATSGIGLAIARELAASGVALVLTGRRVERLRVVQEDLMRNHPIPVDIHAFDITIRRECEVFRAAVTGPVDILINNAGLAKGLDPVQTASLDDWEVMMATNSTALFRMTRLFAADMVARGSGHILNVGSLAGHEAYPNGSVYSASKHAVYAFTRALKMDLNGTGVRVGMVSPGLVETEFSEVRFHGDTERAKSVYAGFDPLTAQDIAEIVHFILNRPDHVNILDALVLPVAQASSVHVARR
jgi:3-hydroxy acid dehydrogenase / malonic semialdehyde reductase